MNIPNDSTPAPSSAVAAPASTLAVADLLPLPQYRERRQQVFPSEESLRWFVRCHQRELIERGALVMPTGRKLIAPQSFDLAVFEIGSRMASERGARRAR